MQRKVLKRWTSTFDVFCLVLEAVQGEDDAAHQHVGVHQGAVDLGQEGLELWARERERVRERQGGMDHGGIGPGPCCDGDTPSPPC